MEALDRWDLLAFEHFATADLWGMALCFVLSVAYVFFLVRLTNTKHELKSAVALTHTGSWMEHINIASTYNTFFHLVKELETFVDTTELKIAFDTERNAYIIGNGFTERIEANFASHREVGKAIREIISKHCPRIHPQS